MTRLNEIDTLLLLVTVGCLDNGQVNTNYGVGNLLFTFHSLVGQATNENSGYRVMLVTDQHQQKGEQWG